MTYDMFDKHGNKVGNIESEDDIQEGYHIDNYKGINYVVEEVDHIQGSGYNLTVRKNYKDAID